MRLRPIFWPDVGFGIVVAYRDGNVSHVCEACDTAAQPPGRGLVLAVPTGNGIGYVWSVAEDVASPNLQASQQFKTPFDHLMGSEREVS